MGIIMFFTSCPISPSSRAISASLASSSELHAQFTVISRELGRVHFQLSRLCLNRVLLFFNAQHRPDSGHERDMIYWLREIFVRTSFESSDNVFRIRSSCHQDDRHEWE